MDKPPLIGIIGAATTTVAILVKFVGLPDQVIKNYKRKSTEGLSVPFFLFGLLSYVLWTFYGILKGDLVVALGQGAGVLTMGIIAYQIWLYRKRK